MSNATQPGAARATRRDGLSAELPLMIVAAGDSFRIPFQTKQQAIIEETGIVNAVVIDRDGAEMPQSSIR
jgi:hypothetical protein